MPRAIHINPAAFLVLVLAILHNALSLSIDPGIGEVFADSNSAQTALDRGIDRWMSHNMSDYDYRYSADCPTWPCDDPLDSRQKNVQVRNGTIASVELTYNWDDAELLPEHIDAVKTPEDLFAVIQSAIDDNADTIQTEYDRNYGHPTYVYIDYSDDDGSDPKYSFRIETLIDLRVTESRQTELDTHRALWDSHRAIDYDYYYRRSCFCMEDYTRKFEVQVRNDTVDAAFVAEDGTAAPDDLLENWLPTIDGIFDQIQSAIGGSAYSMTIRYNETYGYPMSVSVDYNQMMADEELYVSASDLIILETEPVEDLSADATDHQAELDAFRILWNSHRAIDYDYYYQRSCECVYEYTKQFEVHVRNDAVDAAFAVEDGSPAPEDMLESWLPTIENLFDQIQSAIDQSAASVSVRYNLTYGYPLSINIDYDEKIADEELYVTASGLEILATEAEDVDPLPQIIEKQSSKSAQNPDISGCYLVGVRTTGAFALAAFALGIAGVMM